VAQFICSKECQKTCPRKFLDSRGDGGGLTQFRNRQPDEAGGNESSDCGLEGENEEIWKLRRETGRDKERARTSYHVPSSTEEGRNGGWQWTGKFKWRPSCLLAKFRDCKICDYVWLNWIAASGTLRNGLYTDNCDFDTNTM